MLLHVPRLSHGPWTDERVDDLIALASEDGVGVHGLTESPEEADVILFPQCHMVDWRLRTICEHPIARRHWSKVMVYDERAIHWKSFPGLYVSAPRSSFDPRMQRAWSYLRVPSDVPPSNAEPDLLFSFVGSATAACRRPLLSLRHSDAIIEEVTNFMFWDTEAPLYEKRRQRYRDVLSRSRFILCPRGTGTSSFRMYEAIAAGRVPVIISNEWVEPSGPQWQKFSVRFPEGTTDGLIDLLESLEARWEEMSAAALAAYESFFERRVMFHRFTEQLRTLAESDLVHPTRNTLRFRALTSATRQRLGIAPST